MKDKNTYACQIDRDFQDENYFTNIIPQWLGQEDDSQADDGIVPELPEEIRQIDEKIPPIADAADVDELSAPECTDIANGDDTASDNAAPDDDCDAEPAFHDFAADEESGIGPYKFWGYEDEPVYEELCGDEDDEMILQESFCYADAVTLSDDDGWFYED